MNIGKNIIYLIVGFIIGITLGYMAGGSVAATPSPLGNCELQCIADHPDDPKARVNCMIECVSDED